MGAASRVGEGRVIDGIADAAGAGEPRVIVGTADVAEADEPRVIGGIADVAELYAGRARQVQRLVRRGARASEPVIEDACQVAWSRLVAHRRRVRRDTAVAWLVRTGIREAGRLVARDGRDVSLERLIEDTGDLAHLTRTGIGPSPHELVESRARLEALGLLSQRQQRLVWLQGLGLSYAEMADQTGATPRTVERQILRARRKLRLDEPAPGPGQERAPGQERGPARGPERGPARGPARGPERERAAAER
jgi:RNA polymerase sigma factor (sigma-70 family)